MKISGIRLLGAMLCIAVSGVSAAQDASPIQVTNAVFQEVEVKADDGSVTTKLVPAARVVPGGEVVYRLEYRNNGDQPATNVNIDNPLSAELVFVSADTAPTAVSVDGGESFGELAELFVIGSDGEPRPAKAADVTNLRWTVPSLAPGASGSVSFRALVK